MHGYNPITMTSHYSVMLYMWRHIYMEHDDNSPHDPMYPNRTTMICLCKCPSSLLCSCSMYMCISTELMMNWKIQPVMSTPSKSQRRNWFNPFCADIIQHKYVFTFFFVFHRWDDASGWQWIVYPTFSIPWLLTAWWHKEPGHQQPWCWPSSLGILQPQRLKG